MREGGEGETAGLLEREAAELRAQGHLRAAAGRVHWQVQLGRGRVARLHSAVVGHEEPGLGVGESQQSD